MAQTSGFQADVVICGSGFAGFSAALTARAGGAEVIMLEKRHNLGGTSNFVEGTYGVESPMQLARGINITREQAFRTQMDFSHWAANAGLVRAFIEKAADNVRWLQHMGAEYEDLIAMYPGSSPVWHLFKADNMFARGAEVINIFAAKAKESGIRILTDTAAKELLLDRSKKIAGIMAKDKAGNTIQIKSRAVIIATGDFANNKEMLEKYTRFGDAAPTFNAGMMGDGIKMAWAAGAASEGLATVLGFLHAKGDKPERSHIGVTVRGSYLWVNQAGERFCAEDIGYVSINAIAIQPGRLMYVIFDETAKNKLEEEGATFHRGKVTWDQAEPFDLDTDIKSGIKTGSVFVADTLAELGKKICINAATFKETISEYTRCCKQRYDDVFFKNAKDLQPITAPKFYAVKACTSLLNTLGGIKINGRAEVISTDSRVIPGLYASGNCAGGLYGDTYDVNFTTGGASAFAIGTGRIAGENVLKYIEKA
jgi:fumarate reductase flavoprotein subunit